MHHTLESSKAFPYIAWGLIASGILFVGLLIYQLQQVTDSFATYTTTTATAASDINSLPN